MDILNLSTDATIKLDPELVKQITNQQLSLTKKSDEKIVSGRVIIDLSNESNYSDFLLEDGDKLHVLGLPILFLLWARFLILRLLNLKSITEKYQM